MQRLKASGTSIVGSMSAARLKRSAVSSWAAVQDTFYSTKDVFERHKVVFTVGTSVASVATACVGYSLRHYHDVQIDRRLESIEQAMRKKHQLEDTVVTKVDPGNISLPACFATAATSFVIGYCLGWRGGRQYANKLFRKEQMNSLGEIKPRSVLFMRLRPKELNFPFRRTSGNAGTQESGSQIRNKTLKDTPSQEHQEKVISLNQ